MHPLPISLARAHKYTAQFKRTAVPKILTRSYGREPRVGPS